MRKLSLGWSIGLMLSLATACGESDSSDAKSSGGTGGATGQTAGTNSSSGSGNKAGSSNSGGTSSGPGGGGFSTDVPGDTPLNELTPDEVTQLCDDLGDYYNNSSIASDFDELICRYTGILVAGLAMSTTDEELQAACQQGYDSCMEDPGGGTSDCTPPEQDCTATVAELEACANASGDYLPQALDSFPDCDEVTLEYLGDPNTTGPMSPAACATFDMKCPGSELVPFSESP